MSLVRTFFDPIEEFETSFWPMFNPTTTTTSNPLTTTSLLSPSSTLITADVTETPTQFIIHCDVPGFDRNNLKVFLDDEKRMLRIRGERSYSRVDENERRRLTERQFGTFSRSFMVPESVNLSTQPEAKMDQGVLQITMKKKEESAQTKEGQSSKHGKRIEIQ